VSTVGEGASTPRHVRRKIRGAEKRSAAAELHQRAAGHMLPSGNKNARKHQPVMLINYIAKNI